MIRENLTWVLLQCLHLEIRLLSDLDRRVCYVTNSIRKPSCDKRSNLYSIAAVYDISGRSNMTKAELVTAILEVIERRYTDPLAPVDIEFPNSDSSADATSADASTEPNTTSADSPSTDSSDDNGGNGQLNAMLSLLETHSDKWQSADGDARYEVKLPDGSVESARTKDDVRATLFKHY